MGEIWPNFTEKGAGSHGPAPIQTKRVSGTGTGGVQDITVTWDSPFADANYTVVYSVLMVTGNTPVDDGIVSLTNSAVQIAVNIGNLQQFVIHAVAFHD